MPYTLETLGAFPLDPLRDERDAATILDIMRRTGEWAVAAPHAASAFNVMRRYAMAVWEHGRYPGERIWRLGSSGLPWSPQAHAMVSAVAGSRGKTLFTFDGDTEPRGRLTLEHVVPSAVVQARLQVAEDVPGLVAALRDSYRVAVVTTQEGALVLPRKAMPGDWDGTDLWARYRASHRDGLIDFEVEDMLIGPTFGEMRPLRDWVSDGAHQHETVQGRPRVP